MIVTAWGEAEDLASVLDPPFVEVWARRLGPTATLFLQTTVRWLYNDGEWIEAIEIDTDEMASMLGVGGRSDKILRNAIDRLAYVGLAIVTNEPDVVSVRCTWPHLSHRMLGELPHDVAASYLSVVQARAAVG